MHSLLCKPIEESRCGPVMKCIIKKKNNDFTYKYRQGRGKEKKKAAFFSLIMTRKSQSVMKCARQNKQEGLKYLASWKLFTPALPLSSVCAPVRGQKGMNPSALWVIVPLRPLSSPEENEQQYMKCLFFFCFFFWSFLMSLCRATISEIKEFFLSAFHIRSYISHFV